MLTKLVVRNFKPFEYAEIELAERVVFVGPNNSGKSSALQALALWNLGVRRWVERRGSGRVPRERAGVTINRKDLIAVPTPAANLLWRDMHVREGYREEGRTKTRNVLIEIGVEGIADGRTWSTALEFDYANEESFYCRSMVGADGERQDIPQAAANVRLAYLPPMSGLAAVEPRHDEGFVGVLVGEGRTAEVLRNLCWQVLQRGDEHWELLASRIHGLFGVQLERPEYLKERGEIVMKFRTARNVRLDLSSSGRGQQQTLLLLAHLAANPGSILLLDEPDAHLEILRQRQIYQVLAETAGESGSQIIAASHSEVILNEAADRDTVVAFVGHPHRIDDRGSHVLKALKDIGFEHYLQAEERGWVLYLEGSTDLAILLAFARRLQHPAAALLERPFVHYVSNQPGKTRAHFYGLAEAKPDLVGVALYDRLDLHLEADSRLSHLMWNRREIENYLCQRETLLRFAEHLARQQHGDLFAQSWRDTMAGVIDEIVSALQALGKPDPWGPDIKASDDFLDPVFRRFYQQLGLPNLMRKTDYHTLATFVGADEIAPEITAKLDAVVEIAGRTHRRGAAPSG